MAWLPSSSDLLGELDRRVVAQYAERRERFQEPQLVLVHADRVENGNVQRPHFDVLHAGSLQRPRRPFAALGDALRPDEAVVLVLDLQHVGVQLAVVAVDLDADFFVFRVGRLIAAVRSRT